MRRSTLRLASFLGSLSAWYSRLAGRLQSGACGTGFCKGHVTPKRLLHSNFGCCIGTIQKSATYKISGALQRREVPIRELVENKARRLKGKNSTRRDASVSAFFGRSAADYISLYNGDASLLLESLECVQRTATTILTAIGADEPSEPPA